MNTDSLRELYQRIHDCHECPEMDNEKALRRVDAVADSIDTFLISQTLAREQLRRSGVNFFTLEAKLGNTGERLETFLNLFDRTAFPPRVIALSNGVVIPESKKGYVPAYNTESAQCYPMKQSGMYTKEIVKCYQKGFVFEEINLIRPKLLLLMGDKSRRSFYKHYLGAPRKDNLSEHIDSIVAYGRIPRERICGREIHVMPIQHASGANTLFPQMLENEGLIAMVRDLLC